MTDLLSFWFYAKKPEINFDSMKEGYNLGEQCQLCAKKILYSQSMTPCQCRKYFHQNCLKRRLDQVNQSGLQSTVKCQVCKNDIQVEYLTDFVLKLNCKIKNILWLVTSVIALCGIASLCFNMKGVSSNVQIVVAFLLSICISITFVFMMNTFVVKQYKVFYIKSTNLSLLISAFIDLQNKDISQQVTQCQMIRQQASTN